MGSRCFTNLLLGGTASSSVSNCFYSRVLSIATKTPAVAKKTFPSNLAAPLLRLSTWRNEVSIIPPDDFNLPQNGPPVDFGASAVLPVSAVAADASIGESPSVTVTVMTTTSGNGSGAPIVTVFGVLVATGAAVCIAEALVGGVPESVPGMPTFGSPDICLPTFSSKNPGPLTFPGAWY